MKSSNTKSNGSAGKSYSTSGKTYKKPASISKHAKIIGRLGGRPPKNAQN